MKALTELTRRKFLGNVATGVMGMGLQHLIARDALASPQAPLTRQGQARPANLLPGSRFPHGSMGTQTHAREDAW
jgi:hypothetical protein